MSIDFHIVMYNLWFLVVLKNYLDNFPYILPTNPSWPLLFSFMKDNLHLPLSLHDREVACSAQDCQVSNFEFCVWRAVSTHSSHHPEEVLLAQICVIDMCNVWFLCDCGLRNSFILICISHTKNTMITVFSLIKKLLVLHLANMGHFFFFR